MSQPVKGTHYKQTSNAVVALKFMNRYKKLCNSRQTRISINQWIKNNALLTDQFKAVYKKILDEAYKADPEIGLDFDPIFNAQDYPDKGFKIIKYDRASGYVTLGGIDWKEFFVTVKIIFQNKQWMVDGAGIINMPNDKQSIPEKAVDHFKTSP